MILFLQYLKIVVISKIYILVFTMLFVNVINKEFSDLEVSHLSSLKDYEND